MVSRRRGAVAVEFALVLPILLALLIGVLEWGRVLEREVALVQVVRDGALAAARSAHTLDHAGVARARITGGLPDAGFAAADADISVTPVVLACGAALEVRVSLPFAPMVPLVPVPASLSSVTTVRLEDP